VLDALSFIGALGLERAARLHSGGVGTSAGSALAVSAEAPDPRLDAVPAAAEDPVERPRLGVAGFALFHGGLVPADALAFGAGARLSWRMPGLQPWVLLGAYLSRPEQVALGAGRLRFEHWSTHAVGCPWRFPASGALGLRPCLELDVGRTTGEAFGVPGATRRSAPWLAAGAGVRAEFSPWQRLELGMALAGVAPLWHSRFYLRPDLTGFDTPRVGYRAEAYTCVLF
jgi:hypothetical protein